MKKHFVRIIKVALDQRTEGDNDSAAPEGEEPDLLAKRCKALARYVIDVRLPSSLKGLKVWVESRVRAENDQHVLDLLLFYSGQMPLQFKPPRGKGVNAGLLEEMDRLAASIQDALARSNDIWGLTAEIINTETDPADEVEHVRLTSGYRVPSRARRSKVPEILHLLSRDKPLPLFTPELRPEYVESTELRLTATASLNSERLKLSVDDVHPRDREQPFATRVRPKDRLAARWPDEDPRPWILLAWISKFMEMPMTLRGHAAISVDTLNAKAFEVQSSENAWRMLMRLIEFMAPVLDSQAVEKLASRANTRRDSDARESDLQ